MKLAVVVAAYDERQNVGPLTRRLLATLGAMPEVSFELIFVVDGTDGTREVLDAIVAEGHPVRAFYAEMPRGLGNAFRRGFAAVPADADVVVTLDADLNHQPEEIPRLVAALAARNADIVIGSRFVAGSHVEGTPLWKRFLSGTMNVAIKGLFGLDVRDKTSGFRVYRAASLRRLPFANDDFAFLPEILVLAHRAGMTAVEEPIRFVYRVEGVSKMAIVPTVRSYIRLLAGRFDALSLATLVSFGVGVLVRVVALFPVHKFLGDADALLTGIRALDILGGSFPVFYSGVRIGALESYLHVPAVALLGPTRAAVSLTPVIVNVLTLLVYTLFCRAVLPRPLASVAVVLMAVPSADFLLWTSLPNGYPSTVFLGLSTLMLARRVATDEGRGASAVLLGLAAGLGFWNSIQTIACTATAGLWILWHRRREAFRARLVVPVLLGFLLGAAPWIAFNVRYPLASLRQGYAARPAPTFAAMIGNGAYAIRGPLADLLLSIEPGTRPPAPLHRALQIPVLVVYLAALVALLYQVGTWLRRRSRAGKTPPPPWLLMVLPGILSIVLFSISEAGGFRGLTSRYLIYCWFAVPVGVALLAGSSGRVWRLLVVPAVALVVVFNAAGYAHPWGSQRKAMAAAARDDERVVEFLESRSIEAVIGDYWSVYPLNYLAGGRLRGIAVQPPADYYEYWRKLPTTNVRWALLWTDPAVVAEWVRRAGLAGVTSSVGPSTIFLPGENPPANLSTVEFVRRLRAAFHDPRPIVP